MSHGIAIFHWHLELAIHFAIVADPNTPTFAVGLCLIIGVDLACSVATARSKCSVRIARVKLAFIARVALVAITTVFAYVVRIDNTTARVIARNLMTRIELTSIATVTL